MSTKPFILPKDIPLDQYPKPETFLAEGKRIVDAATSAGIILRVMGPLALHYYFPNDIDQLNQDAYERWAAAGSKTLRERARAKASELLSEPIEPVVEPGLREGLFELAGRWTD